MRRSLAVLLGAFLALCLSLVQSPSASAFYSPSWTGVTSVIAPRSVLPVLGGSAGAASTIGALSGAASIIAGTGVSLVGLGAGYGIGTLGVKGVEAVYTGISKPGGTRGTSSLSAVLVNASPYGEPQLRYLMSARFTGVASQDCSGDCFGWNGYGVFGQGRTVPGALIDDTCTYSDGSKRYSPYDDRQGKGLTQSDDVYVTKALDCAPFATDAQGHVQRDSEGNPILLIAGASSETATSMLVTMIPVVSGLRVSAVCRAVSGAARAVSQAVYFASDGSVTIPQVRCEDGETMDDYSLQGIDGNAVDIVPLVPTITTPVVDPATGCSSLSTCVVVPATPAGTPATGWDTTDPETGDTDSGEPSPGCYQGSVFIPASRCYPTPTSPDPTVDPSPSPTSPTSTAPGPTADPSPTPTATPTGTPTTDPEPDPDPDPDPSEPTCYPTGWSAFNPVEWVLKPVKCALSWAFIPSAATTSAIDDITVDIQTKTPLPELKSITNWFQPPVEDGRCWDLRAGFPAGSGLPSEVAVLNSCDSSNPIVAFMISHRAALSAVIWFGTLAPFAWWAWRQYAPGASGVA